MTKAICRKQLQIVMAEITKYGIMCALAAVERAGVKESKHNPKEGKNNS